MADREERVLTQRVPAARFASPEQLGHLQHCDFNSDFRRLPNTASTYLHTRSQPRLWLPFNTDLASAC